MPGLIVHHAHQPEPLFAAMASTNNQDSPIPINSALCFFENALSRPTETSHGYALTQLARPVFVTTRWVCPILRHATHPCFNSTLRAVTLHPAGFYLSHVNNAKTDEDANTFPDENYAREVKLFTIGLYELNSDGTRKLDAEVAIPTYATGYCSRYSRFLCGRCWPEPQFAATERLHLMVMFDNYRARKVLALDLRCRMDRMYQDIDEITFQPPNVALLVSKQLIQRLVTSNPSSDYVRISVFADNGERSR